MPRIKVLKKKIFSEILNYYSDKNLKTFDIYFFNIIKFIEVSKTHKIT